MICKYFGKCGSCTLYKISYDEQISQKLKNIKEEFAKFYDKDIKVFTSQDAYFRNRAEFRIWHNDDKISYAMNGFAKKKIVVIDKCYIVDEKIANMMPKVLEALQNNSLLRNKLFSIEYMSGESMLVVLIYHKKIDEVWLKEAKKIEKKLNIHIIGRSRGVKMIASQDFIIQNLKIIDKEYHYKVYENSFLQPNTKVNEKMISWVKENTVDFKGDLLELYCGHGNFTIPLSENFDKVLATEISKSSIKSAQENVKLNNTKNISFVRLSSEELTKALNGEREFRRLKDINLKKFHFGTVFVDPPRAGVDEKTLNLLQKFEHIVYISCNPETLKRDLEILTKTYKIIQFAIFDQFAYTNHLECGAIMIKKYKVYL